ncbi:MAG: FkbM family methyltransferase [Flavobacteriales bacterium]|nr:FkbM family methyltransferase [Flavobacteriales bacterium]
MERIDVLKIDIEGGELAALRGAEVILGNSPRMMLVIEIIDDHCKRAGYSGRELFDFIVGKGFKGYLPKPWPRVEAVAAYDPGYFDNIIFLKGYGELSPLRRAERSPRSRLWDPCSTS